MNYLPQHSIERLAHIGLNTPDAAGLCQFYERVLGFRVLTAGRRTERVLARMSGPPRDAFRLTLGLGDEVVELLQFDRPGRPIPLRLRFGSVLSAFRDRRCRYVSPISSYRRWRMDRRSRPMGRNACRPLREASGIQISRS